MNIIKELYAYREMLRSLVHRDLRGRYKGSVMGFMWTFINPLLQLGVYTILFSHIMRAGVDDYYLFLFVALIPWMFFSSSIMGGATSILSNQSMVTKIYFPREVLPISVVTSAFVNMLYCFIVVLVAVFLLGKNVSVYAWSFLPVVAGIEYLLALGFAMIVAAITVYFRDMEHILGIVTLAWQFLTPVMYGIDMVPKEYLLIFNLNPMTSIIVAYRDILYYGKVPQIETLISALFFGVLFLMIGFVVFGRLKRHFAEEL